MFRTSHEVTGVGVKRRTSSAPAGSATIADRDEEPGRAGVGALADRVDEAEQPGERGEAMQLAPALRADPAAEVVGEAEDREHPAADDPGAHPQPRVARDERDRDVGEARLEVAVAEQRERVHGERHERRQRERLVPDARVGQPADAGAHQQPERDRRARGQQRGDARGAARDPEEVLAHQDWLVVRVEPSGEADDDEDELSELADDASSVVVEDVSSELVVSVEVEVVACAVVVVSEPIEPLKATTPQASTKDASTAATTRRRIAEMRRARAARRSWAEGMTTIVDATAERPL